MTNWLQHDYVIEQMALATAWLVDGAGTQNYQRVLSQAIESPLEASFLVWWQVHQHTFRIFPELSVDVKTQVPITIGTEQFRLDASFVPSDPIFRAASEKFRCPLKVAIEFDGHEFHERTKEQVARRNHRDRVLQLNGWSVLHFSGSELFNDPAVWAPPFINAVQPRMDALRAVIAGKLGVPAL